MTSPLTASTLGPSSAAALKLENILYEKRNGIAYVTVNRPKVLNALNTPTWADIRTAFEDARDDTAVHGVILTGAGNKAFIAGADISELAHATALDAERACAGTEDKKEGTSAFLEKRAPQFRGR
jgi:enoyl-CoA hydratase/carnithine racemase